MGSSITIAKHTTSIDDWLQIQNKLQQVQFNAFPNTHLMGWKFCIEQLDQSIVSSPLVLDSQNNSNLFSNQECYLVALVVKNQYQPNSKVDSNITTILSSLVASVSQKSLQLCIRQGVVEGAAAFNGKCYFYTYAFFGKRAKNNIKLTVLSYAYKLAKFLNSPQRLKIITGGGVFRNKKLQIGSVVPLTKPKGSGGKNINQFMHVHIVSQLSRQTYQTGIDSFVQNNNMQFSLFQYKPQQNVQIIQDKKKRFKDDNQIYRKKQVNTKINNIVPPIKPPMLKLALKTYQQITYEQMDQQQKNQKFDIRATARHQLKMQKFEIDCSMIIQGLYLSGEKVAKDQEILKKHKISQIVNCAGDYCPNWFQQVRSQQNPSIHKYKYLTFFLKDSQNQNIQCLFYKVIDFINNALTNKRNVLVHCIQGISRSVTFIIAYLIFTNGYDYKKAQSFVKNKRSIACPNNGFMVQLIQFYKRLHQKFDSLPSPRVFLISSHCQQTPDIITARMLKQQLFNTSGKNIGLDQRAIYIIQSQDILYLWMGAKCDDQKKMKIYWSYAQSYIKKLQQYEKAPLKVKAIHQGNEGRDFLMLWGVQEISKQYRNTEYDRLFNQQKPTPKPGYLRKHYERQQDSDQQQFCSKLFVYPDYQKGVSVFQIDDLCGFCLIVKSDSQKIKVFIWKQESWDSNTQAEGQFLDNVIELHYASYDPEKIQLIQQKSNLSQQFLSCFN